MSCNLPHPAETILACELSLLHSDHRAAPERLQHMLAAEFCEITPAGTISSRQEVIDWLLLKSPTARWELSEACLRHSSDTLRILSYHARQLIPEKPDSKGAQHLSIWCWQAEHACWQLNFHQSTKII